MATLLLVLVSLSAVISAALYVRSNRKKKGGDSKLPPGYTGWRFIGEIFSFLKPCLSTSLGNFMEHRIARFGKIFTTNMLGKPAIVSADPELNRFVLQNEMRLFESDWPRHFNELIGETSVVLQMGDVHKQLRSITVGFFSTARLQTSFLCDANQLAKKAFGSWKDGSVVSAVDAAQQFTFNVMVKNVLSMEPGKPETEKLRGEYERLSTGLFSIIPLNFPGTKYYKSLQSRKIIRKVIKQIMEERTNAKGNTESEGYDLLGWVMKNTSLSSEQIGDLIHGAVLTSEETTSMAIAASIYFLEACPKAIEQLRGEHLQIVRSKKQEGESKLTWDDYKQMEFTQCVINETLRLGNVVRLLHKKASTDIRFRGYEIPSGCKVLAHVSAVHLDPSIFEDPEHFNPWRWLSASGIKKTNNFLPFGGGPRLCPGAELARLEIAVFLHHLILNYNWDLVEHDQPIAFPKIEFPKGLPIKVHALSL